MRAVVFGEIIWDVYPDRKSIGGAPLNFAAHLSNLGNDVWLASAVGRDDLGKEGLSIVAKFGIHNDLLKVSSFPTGVCNVTLGADGIPAYDVKAGVAYDNIQISDSDIQYIKALNADVFYFNTLIQRSNVSLDSLTKILNHCHFDDIFCDVNIRENSYSKSALLLCLSHATILKISEEEAHYLYDEGIVSAEKDLFSELASAFGNLRLIILTKGKNGSLVYDVRSGKAITFCDVPLVKVVSTVGAGDCYSAAFLHSIFCGNDIFQAMRFASERCSRVVSSKESVPVVL